MKDRKKNVLYSIKSFLKEYGLIIAIIIPIMILINWGLIFIIERDKENIEIRQKDLVEQQFNTIDFIISSGIANTHNDLHVIQDAEEMTNYIANPNATNLESLEQLIYRIANNKPEFLSISIVDLLGNEIAKINRVNDSLSILDEDDLSNISDNQIFVFAQLLEPLELYMSPIELSIDSIPTTKFVVNMYDQEDNLNFHLLIKYNANTILSIFDEYKSTNIKHITLGLINNNQLWTINNSANEANIFELSELPSNFDQDNVFIHNLKIDDMIEHNVYNDEGFLKIYGNINYQGAYNEYGSYLLKYPVLIYLINIALFIGIFSLALTLKSKNENRLLLNANMYLSDKNKDGVLITDNKFRISYINEAFTNIYGYTLSEIKGELPHEIFYVHQFQIDPNDISTTNIFAENIWNNSKSGIFILKYLRIRPETTASGKNKHYIEIFSDPKLETKSLSTSLLNQNSTDLDLMISAFRHLPFNSKTSCFMVLKLYNENNVSNSKSTSSKINDEYKFANFLRKNMDKSFDIAAPGFDYTIVYSQKENTSMCIKSLELLLEKYKHLPSTNPRLEYHFGVALTNPETKSKKELFYQAVLALEMTIKQKNTKHLVYQESMRKTLDREKEIYAELENAFNKNEFQLNYQIQLDSLSKEHIGAEALLRWNNQTLGNIRPDEFIPVIENSFYVNRLTLMVIKLAIKDFTPYVKYFKDNFRLSINLTSFDFSNEYIIHDIIQTIEKSKIDTKHFCFEITESGYLTNKEKANEVIDYLHSKNIIVAIDDFGTGFSSIGALKDIKIDIVKIDRTFIKNFPNNDSGLMFKSLTQLVHNLGIEILAEGIETKDQLDFSIDNNCRDVQGYFFSKPLPIKVFVEKYIENKEKI
ncbi:MAG: EAL domain-containing protein [Candidatus Izimaplasma sp.]|nr:EAL domain-containing protein [Candidatus Izimaplasma bacterium]